MPERRRESALPVACVVFAMLLPAVYVAGYFALSVNQSGATANSRCRIFRSRWLTEIYKPAAKVESAVTGDTVSTYWQQPTP